MVLCIIAYSTNFTITWEIRQQKQKNVVVYSTFNNDLMNNMVNITDQENVGNTLVKNGNIKGSH